jgi:hypothetical protein
MKKIPLEPFFQQLTPDECKVVESLDTPVKIARFLDGVQYPGGERNRSMVNVLRELQAHCLDGGLFAALMLHRLGHPAVMIDLLPEPGMDDDHILALFRQNGRWGCVAKSNFTGLRYRDPVYANLRELVMSYFEVYFNMQGVKTLRGYTRPIHLARFSHLNWLTEDTGVDAIEKYLKGLPAIPLLTTRMIQDLTNMDERSLQAGMFGVNLNGLYKG